MPTASIDGIDVNYEVMGSGSPLLLFAPGGFDATIEKWREASAWKEMGSADVRKRFTTGTQLGRSVSLPIRAGSPGGSPWS